MFAHLNKSNDFPTALQTLMLPARGCTPLPPSPLVNPPLPLLARPSLPPWSDSTALIALVLLDCSGGPPTQPPVHTPSPCHLPFAPRVSAKLSSFRVSGTARSVIFSLQLTHTHPEVAGVGGLVWLGRAKPGKGDRILLGELGTRVALARGHPAGPRPERAKLCGGGGPGRSRPLGAGRGLLASGILSSGRVRSLRLGPTNSLILKL